MAKSGRTSKFTPERAEKILEALRLGVPQNTAVTYGGISESTFYNWLADAKKDDAPTHLVEFLESVKAARAEAEVRSVAIIQNAARKQWQAAAWFLERSFPSHWAKTDRHEITGKDGGAIELNVDTEALESKLQNLIAKRKGETDETGAVVE
jgi:hypothetical protein